MTTIREFRLALISSGLAVLAAWPGPAAAQLLSDWSPPANIALLNTSGFEA